MNRFLWFLMGVATGIAAMAVLKRVQEDQEVEDVEAIADSIAKRLDELEGKAVVGK